ncbi:MAG: hypothetical protein IIA02_12220 [Proteobacteria bacterium]|uniref:hypothetical protein n=1 Tax=Aquabacterium sp. TaxID=1872578 RepID=UPI0035C711A2|nr:hypothetical protein [Pseudomonadota bacterium]
MDIYLDRTVALGQPRPYGQPDFCLPLDDHVFHVAEPRTPRRSLPVRLTAAVYSGTTDVLHFVAEPLDGGAEPRWVQLADVLHAPLSELPRLAFDADRINRIAELNAEASLAPAHARLRGLTLTADDQGRPRVAPDPDAPPRLLSGIRSQDHEVRLTATNAQGLPTADLSVSVDELTADTRRQALEWMAARHAALADIDALHALHPALRAISRARQQRHTPGDLSAALATIRQRRARAHQELSELLGALRQSA